MVVVSPWTRIRSGRRLGEQRLHGREHARAHLVGRLGRLHDLQVVVDADPERLDEGVEQGRVLGDATLMVLERRRKLLEPPDHRGELDHLGPGAEQGEDSGGHAARLRGSGRVGTLERSWFPSSRQPASLTSKPRLARQHPAHRARRWPKRSCRPCFCAVTVHLSADGDDQRCCHSVRDRLGSQTKPRRSEERRA